MNGFLVVNKPTDYTSRDVVNVVGKMLNTKKVGHTGTLDPLATGVLVIAINKYTKLVDLVTSFDKEYIATIKLGIKTDTGDITGKVIETKKYKFTKKWLIKTLNSFLGVYHMQVPLYSAVKIKGKKLYEYARNNIDVELPFRDVNIYDIKLLDYHDDTIKFKVRVSKGTYIRSLINDICACLNTVGTMSSLERTKQGNFTLEDTITIEDIKSNNYKLLSIKDILNIKEYPLSDEEYKKVSNGNKVELDTVDNLIYLTYKSQEIAIYKKYFELYKPYVMLI